MLPGLVKQRCNLIVAGGSYVREGFRLKSQLEELKAPNQTEGVRSPVSSSFSRWSPVPLRLIVGIGFLQHGIAKLNRGPDAFATVLQNLQVPAPHLMAWATIAVEILGGLFILLGAYLSLASIPMATVLLVALFTVHLRYGFSSIKLLAVTPAGARFGPPGIEVNLLYLACLAALVLGGPGPLALRDLRRAR